MKTLWGCSFCWLSTGRKWWMWFISWRLFNGPSLSPTGHLVCLVLARPGKRHQSKVESRDSGEDRESNCFSWGNQRINVSINSWSVSAATTSSQTPLSNVCENAGPHVILTLLIFLACIQPWPVCFFCAIYRSPIVLCDTCIYSIPVKQSLGGISHGNILDHHQSQLTQAQRWHCFCLHHSKWIIIISNCIC